MLVMALQQCMLIAWESINRYKYSIFNKLVVQGQSGSPNIGGYMRLQTATSVTTDHTLGTIAFGDESHNGANIQAGRKMAWSPFT